MSRASSVHDTPPVLLLDDGEFDDVRDLLHDLGVDYDSGVPTRDSDEARRYRLLVTNPRHALAPDATGLGAGPVAAQRIAICDGSSRTVRAQLERTDCDFVVQRPVHVAALRLLILHALYEGPEKRTRPRVALGAPVKLKSGLRSRSAMLLQLSPRGAGIEAHPVPAVGERLNLVLPANLTGGASHTLEATVVGIDGGGDGEIPRSFSVVFAPLASATQSILRKIMRSRPRIEGQPGRSGSDPRPATSRPAAGRPSSGPAPTPTPTASDAPADGEGEGRRASARKRYRRAVLATGAGGAAPLLGRDLSTGGMRVAPTRGIARGDELKLALYGPPGVPPVVVKAVASRDDGEAGWVLRFDDIGPKVRLAIESLVRTLPVLASPLRGDEGSTPVVVSEIVDEDAVAG